MNKLTLRLGVLALFVTLSVTWLFAEATKFTLLHVNDSHSHLDAVGPKDANLEGTLGGIAKAATVIGTVRATEQNVLLLHAGDVFQGDPMFNTYFGVPEFQLMTQLGVDAMAVGNHEFDFGPGVLNDVLSTAFAGGSFPLVSANLDMSAFPALQSWIQPSIMKTVAGVKIGIFGMTVPNNPTNMPAPVIVRDDIVAIAQQTANSLRTDGAQVVIFLSHLGVYLDKIVASNTTGIDFIVGGHDHYLFEQPVMISNPDGRNVPIFQAGEHYKYVGKLHFSVDNGEVTITDYEMLAVNESVPAEPSIQAVIEGLKEGVIAKFGDLYHSAIGTAVSEVTKRYDARLPLRDTPIGNLVTDAFRQRTGTDLAITALGLISEKLYEGPITGADVFRSLSYGFDEATGLGLQLATFEITGAELVKGMEIGLSQLDIGDDFFLQYSGMRFRYDPAKPVGERGIISSIKIDGKRFSPASTYTVTVNTGIIALLGLLGVSIDNVAILPDFEYHVVRDFISAAGNVNYHPQGRVIELRARDAALVEPDAAAELPSAFKLYANYPNPFNPTTVVAFDLPVDGYVSLRVYNALGQEVAVLFDGTQQAGHFETLWNANAAPSGVYYARLSTNGFTEARKMLLVR